MYEDAGRVFYNSLATQQIQKHPTDYFNVNTMTELKKK